jgi:hypothetical protein
MKTNHLSESELTLHYYGDAEDAAAAERHLAECDTCRREFQRLRAVLSSVAMPVPERPPDYEARVWNKLAPQLEPLYEQRVQAVAPPRISPSRMRFAWQRWTAVGAVAALIAAAFFLGRLSERAVPGAGSMTAQSGAAPASASVEAIRHRVLFIALEGHLDRTQMVLTELANADPGPSMDISEEAAAARELLDDNRLYRQTAAQVHDAALVQVLDELERVLVDLSHRPTTISHAEWNEIRHRIESQGILFKIRVVGSEVREQEREMRSSAAVKVKT